MQQERQYATSTQTVKKSRVFVVVLKKKYICMKKKYRSDKAQRRVERKEARGPQTLEEVMFRERL